MNSPVIPTRLGLLPDLYYQSRNISVLLAILTAFVIGLTCFVAIPRFTAFAMGTCLTLGTSGFLFQSLVIRSELSAVFLGSIALFFSAIYYRMRRWWTKLSVAWLMGLTIGFGVLTKYQLLPLVAFALVFFTIVSMSKIMREVSLRRCGKSSFF